VINVLPGRNVYPTYGGPSLGDIATGADVGPYPAEIEVGGGELDQALMIGGQASPVMGLVVFAALLLLIGFIAHRFGEAGAFSNIKTNAYNVIFISLVAVAGIPLWKFLFTKVKVPGVSSWVHSV